MVECGVLTSHKSQFWNDKPILWGIPIDKGSRPQCFSVNCKTKRGECIGKFLLLQKRFQHQLHQPLERTFAAKTPTLLWRFGHLVGKAMPQSAANLPFPATSCHSAYVLYISTLRVSTSNNFNTNLGCLLLTLFLDAHQVNGDT